jgi:hypothetical protein
MYGKPFKMMGKSPMMKKLIGKQNNLPAELKAEIQASPAKKSDPPTEKTVKVDGTTYENPYTAYQNKDQFLTKDKGGSPYAGEKIHSSISGLQVSGPGSRKGGRKRTDKFMKGEAQGGQLKNTVSKDKNKDGLPDNFESTASDKIKAKKTKKLTKAEKIKAYQKSQLTLKSSKKKKK